MQAEDFSDARSSFFDGPSILIGVLPEKTTALGEVILIMVQSAPVFLRAGAVPNQKIELFIS
jgi:hypothetical protein